MPAPEPPILALTSSGKAHAGGRGHDVVAPVHDAGLGDVEAEPGDQRELPRLGGVERDHLGAVQHPRAGRAQWASSASA